MAAKNELQATTGRAAVRELLKREGPISAGSAGQRLGITAMAVRQHLYALRNTGEADHVEEARPRGRPVKLWRATQAADPAASIGFRPAAHEHRDPHSLRMISDSGDVRTLEEIETEVIRFALSHYRGQMSQMARKLGIGRSTLYRKLKDIGIADDDMLGDAAA